MPHAQACVIYILRVVIIRALSEPAQRQLLAKLVTQAGGAIAPPLVITALEGIGVLLEVLGAVVEEDRVEYIQGVVMSKLSMSSSAVRTQVRIFALRLCKAM